MEFTWDFFTITLFAEATIAALLSAVLWLIPFMQFCCLRTKWKRMKGYEKKEDTLTKIMLCFAAGLFVQSFGDTQLKCLPDCRWLIAVWSILTTIIVALLFYCVDYCTIYLVALAGLYWILNQTFPGVNATWNQNLAYVVYIGVVLFAFFCICAFRYKIRSTLLDWIIAALACAIIVYYVDYIMSASYGRFTGPGMDFIGPNEYPDQKIYHIVEMTVLYAVNRGAAIGAAVAIRCYSSKPDDCAYRCRNYCCCCCCETDRLTQTNLEQRARERAREPDRAIGRTLYDYDYGTERNGGVWRTIPSSEDQPQIEGAEDGHEEGEQETDLEGQ